MRIRSQNITPADELGSLLELSARGLMGIKNKNRDGNPGSRSGSCVKILKKGAKFMGNKEAREHSIGEMGGSDPNKALAHFTGI